jgi:DNA-binding response OmpR family regulator
MGSKILLVEGDASAGADLRAALADAGFAVTLVRDGQVGLARAVSEPFDAVIVSAELPGINGFRVCNRIRKDPNVRGVRVFIVGAEADDLAAHARLPTRADSYFEKPLVVAELMARMRLHGVGEAPAGALRAEIASARKDLAIIAELQKRIGEQDALLEATTRELAKCRAERQRTMPPKPAAPPELRALERRLQEQTKSLEDAHREKKALEAKLVQTTLRIPKLAEKQAASVELERRLNEVTSEAEGLRKQLEEARNERAKAEASSEEALRVERQAGLAALERVQREHKNDLAVREETHTRDLVMATGAITKLRKEIAERDQRLAAALAARNTDRDEEAATRWANERAVLEERLRMAEAHSDETAMTVVTAHAEIETLKQRLAAAEAQEAPTLAQVRALEASLVSRSEAVARLERELDDAIREAPALEAEIVVLRSELMNVRRQLDTAVLQERMSDAQLERGRDLLDRAEALFGRRADET